MDTKKLLDEILEISERSIDKDFDGERVRVREIVEELKIENEKLKAENKNVCLRKKYKHCEILFPRKNPTEKSGE